MKRPPLNQLEAFIKVLEYKSFSKAAKSLEVSPPVVSKRVSALEDRLEVTLFRRTTRTLHLTEAGNVKLVEFQTFEISAITPILHKAEKLN